MNVHSRAAVEWLALASPLAKVSAIESVVNCAFGGLHMRQPSSLSSSPSLQKSALGDVDRAALASKPGRDLAIVDPAELPPKPGLSRADGQARLLHDLASIELQAMELAVRTLFEFPEAPTEFREQLAEVAIGESRHLKLCLDSLHALDFDWGHWGAHLALWNAVSARDTLLDRILIVHRYLEGSGLDAGESILRRLRGVRAPLARSTVELIVSEEVDHVEFGSRWYRTIAKQIGVDVDLDFRERMRAISIAVPRREQLARDLRLRAGFTMSEITVLEQLRRQVSQACPSSTFTAV